MKYRVRVTRRARAAIREQIRYIAEEKLAPQNASMVLGAIDTAIDSLSSMPHRGARAPEDAHVGYTVRMLIVKKSFLLLYRIDDADQLVTVVGFRHGRRLPSPEDLPPK